MAKMDGGSSGRRGWNECLGEPGLGCCPFKKLASCARWFDRASADNTLGSNALVQKSAASFFQCSARMPAPEKCVMTARGRGQATQIASAVTWVNVKVCSVLKPGPHRSRGCHISQQITVTLTTAKHPSLLKSIRHDTSQLYPLPVGHQRYSCR